MSCTKNIRKEFEKIFGQETGWFPYRREITKRKQMTRRRYRRINRQRLHVLGDEFSEQKVFFTLWDII